MSPTRRRAWRAMVVVGVLCGWTAVYAQQQPARPQPPIEKLGPSLFKIGELRIDTARGEVSVAGRINDVNVLEWVANSREGKKAYESAITVEADATSFNTALLLVGLDKARSRVPTQHFDPVPPAGDPVEISVEWLRNGERVRVSVDQLLWDQERKRVVSIGAWVYTGSSFLPDGRYTAEVDGTLIGFVHSPTPIIEQVGAEAVGRFGHIVLNPNLGLAVDTPVTLTVRNLASGKR